jgi:hypothetical protein
LGTSWKLDENISRAAKKALNFYFLKSNLPCPPQRKKTLGLLGEFSMTSLAEPKKKIPIFFSHHFQRRLIARHTIGGPNSLVLV